MRLFLLHTCALLRAFAAAKFQAQQTRPAGQPDTDGGEAGGTGSPRLSAQQRMSSMGGAAAMSGAAPSDVTGICGTGYYISVSNWGCAAGVHGAAPAPALTKGHIVWLQLWLAVLVAAKRHCQGSFVHGCMRMPGRVVSVPCSWLCLLSASCLGLCKCCLVPAVPVPSVLYLLVPLQPEIANGWASYDEKVGSADLPQLEPCTLQAMSVSIGRPFSSISSCVW